MPNTESTTKRSLPSTCFIIKNQFESDSVKDTAIIASENGKLDCRASVYILDDGSETPNSWLEESIKNKSFQAIWHIEPCTNTHRSNNVYMIRSRANGQLLAFSSEDNSLKCKGDAGLDVDFELGGKEKTENGDDLHEYLWSIKPVLGKQKYGPHSSETRQLFSIRNLKCGCSLRLLAIGKPYENQYELGFCDDQNWDLPSMNFDNNVNSVKADTLFASNFWILENFGKTKILKFKLGECQGFLKKDGYASTSICTNKTENQITHTFEFTSSISSEVTIDWSSELSINASAETTIGIEAPVSSEVSFSLEISKTLTTGSSETHVNETSSTHSFEATVNPNSEAIVTCIINKLEGEIPFIVTLSDGLNTWEETGNLLVKGDSRSFNYSISESPI